MCFLAVASEAETKHQARVDYLQSQGLGTDAAAAGKPGKAAAKGSRAEVSKLQARIRELENLSGGGTPDMHEEGSGAACAGGGDPNELAELEATIRNSGLDVEAAKQRLAKETSEHHKRVHQQRLDEATATLDTARARKDLLRQTNLDPQVKQLEVSRKGVALKREQTALEAQLRKAADDAAKAKEHYANVAQKYRNNRAAIEANKQHAAECARQLAPKTASEQLQAVHELVVASVQQVASTTDAVACAPAMASVNALVGQLQAALAQVASMQAGAAAQTQAAAGAAPVQQQPPQAPTTVPEPATVVGGASPVDQAVSACPADGAGAQGGQPADTKQAGTGTTTSPTKAAPKAHAYNHPARQPPSEVYNVDALLEQADEYRGGQQQVDANGGTPQTHNKRSRKQKGGDDEEAMSDDEEQDPTH